MKWEMISSRVLFASICERSSARIVSAWLQVQHDVEILGNGPAYGDLAGWLLLVLPEEVPCRVHRGDLLPALEHADIAGDHLLLPVVGHLDTVVAQRVIAERHLAAQLQLHLR